MRKYEIMYIVRTTISEEESKAVVNNFEGILTNNGATIVSSRYMGQRELAYEIKKHKSGHYFVLVVESKDDKAISEFDRLAAISQDVIRHLITKLEN
jgi:small subunit ribosomal protein S6